jgi:hypothetical protein
MFQLFGLEGFVSKFNPRGQREMMGSKKTCRERFALQKRATCSKHVLQNRATIM